MYVAKKGVIGNFEINHERGNAIRSDGCDLFFFRVKVSHVIEEDGDIRSRQRKPSGKAYLPFVGFRLPFHLKRNIEEVP